MILPHTTPPELPSFFQGLIPWPENLDKSTWLTEACPATAIDGSCPASRPGLSTSPDPQHPGTRPGRPVPHIGLPPGEHMDIGCPSPALS